MNKYESERNERMEALESNTRDDGRHGKSFEIGNARLLSRKVSVARQGEVDNAVKFIIDGKAKYIKAESKTNGGRVDDIGKHGERYIIYRLDICNANTGKVRRYVPAKIIPVDMFLEFLKANGLIKAINKGGKLDGYGIQCTSKKLYLALDNYPILFDRERVYTLDDFNGVSLEIE